MKTMKKHLALLLALTMLLGLVVVSTAITVSADPTAILELNMSAFSQQTFVTTNADTESELVGKTSGITATGTLAASTTYGFAARSDGETALTKGSFQNNNGGAITYYLDYYDSKVYPNTSEVSSYSKHTTDVQFFNANLESADNTISFWVDATASKWFKDILCYRVGYTKSDSTTSVRSLDLGINPDGTWNAVCETWSNADHTAAKTSGAFSVPSGWKHVVITNPVRSGDNKTMDVYVNGVYKKSVSLDIPDTATVDSVAVSFFGKSDGANGAKYWKANYWNLPAGKVGEVKVYDTALSASDIADLYTAQLPNFTAYVAPAVQVTKALSLDMTSLAQVKLTPSGSTGEVTSGITKSGTLASSTTISFSQRPDEENSLTKASFPNSTGSTTYYIDYYDSKIWPNTASQAHAYANHLTNLQFFNNDLETSDNMISFWVNDIQRSYDYVLKSVFTYRVDYGTAGCQSFDLVVNPNGTWNLYNEPWIQVKDGIHNPMSMDDGAFTVPTGWKHILITNPARSGGSKTMDLYVNGVLKKSVTLSIPDDATINHVTSTFFGKSSADNEYWRANYNNLASGKLGGVGVYTGTINAENIAQIYSDELPYFTEGSVVSNEVTGYTLSNASFDYDEQSHSLAVVAGAGATEDVTVTYTCGGEPFTGATEVGTYNITATVSKEGYTSQVLTATLTINAVTLPSKLIDLSYDTYVQDTLTTPDGTASLGDVTNNGSLAASTKVIMSSLARYNVNSLIKDTFVNAAGNDTEYLRFAQTSKVCLDPNIYRYLEENALETRANTISVWFKYDPNNEVGYNFMKGIIDYSADYDGVEQHLFEFIKSRDNAKEDGKFIAKSRWYVPNNEKVDITETGSAKWVNLVITNPEYVNGEKTMTAYLDGVELFSKTVTQPSGTLGSVKISIAGQNRRGYWNADQSDYVDHGVSWPENISIGDIDVYDGALTPAQILKVRRDDIAKYTEQVFDAEEATKLIDFDLTNFAQTETAGAGGIVNTGTSTTATITAYTAAKRDAGQAILSADYLYSKDDLSTVKKIVRLHHENGMTPSGTTEDRLNKKFDVEDIALANNAFTLSFWVNVDPISKQTSGTVPIVHYQINRSDGKRTYARLWQYTNDTDTANDYKWTIGYGDPNHLNSVSKAHEWHHVVMAVPAFVNDSAAVKCYIDGIYRPTLDQEIDLAGATATTAKIYLGSIDPADSAATYGDTLNGQYNLAGDISFGDIVVYSTALSEQDIEQLYESQRGTYYDSAFNRITFANGANSINALTDLADNTVITINYDENITPGTQLYVACYTADEELLASNVVVCNETGSTTLTIPADATRVRAFTLKDGYIPIQKIAQILR